jgi:ubiquinone/menaquinone biosynthesis C-methylase UbiE
MKNSFSAAKAVSLVMVVMVVMVVAAAAVHVAAAAAAVVLAFSSSHPSALLLLRRMALAHVFHQAIVRIKRVAADGACQKNAKFLQRDRLNYKALKVLSVYDPVKYKQGAIDNWNRVAPDYHNEWAGVGRGPFQSTKELVVAACIEKGHSVLDLACGTGAVSAQVAARLGQSGTLVGIDFARGALAIARREVPAGHFAEMDAESIGLAAKFDRAVCQYALMFFPDPAKVLEQVAGLLKDGGRLAVAVHGTAKGVPYFSTIMEPVLGHIPDIRPDGTPTVHRFGEPSELERVLSSAGFTDVAVKKFVFSYDAGTFDDYWSDYMSTTAASIRSKIEAKGEQVVKAIREEAEQRARPYIRGGAVDFPWDVLVAVAKK